jgi:hypothetical protein
MPAPTLASSLSSFRASRVAVGFLGDSSASVSVSLACSRALEERKRPRARRADLLDAAHHPLRRERVGHLLEHALAPGDETRVQLGCQRTRNQHAGADDPDRDRRDAEGAKASIEGSHTSGHATTPHSPRCACYEGSMFSRRCELGVGDSTDPHPYYAANSAPGDFRPRRTSGHRPRRVRRVA